MTPTAPLQPPAHGEDTPPAARRRPGRAPPGERRGIGIIASILGILVFILLEVLPLARPAAVLPERTIPLATPVLAALGDEYRTHLAALSPDGRVRVLRLEDGAVVAERAIDPAAPAQDEEAIVAAMVPPGSSLLAAATTDGRVVLQEVDWEIAFDEGLRRTVTPRLEPPLALAVDPERRPLAVFAAVQAGETDYAAAGLTAGGTVRLVTLFGSENLLTGEIETTEVASEAPAPAGLDALVLDHQVRNLFGGTANGDLVWWPVEDGRLGPPQAFPAGSSAVTALTLLIGDRTLVAGQADGTISVWFLVRQADESFQLTRIRDFPGSGRRSRSSPPRSATAPSSPSTRRASSASTSRPRTALSGAARCRSGRPPPPPSPRRRTAPSSPPAAASPRSRSATPTRRSRRTRSSPASGTRATSSPSTPGSPPAARTTSSRSSRSPRS
ncbi:MAG: hypothetical protein M5U13_01350 [Thermoanaerobaculia bacterium]|nr:hypothetical protein [Thermoanaerobaculia bacterium]